MEIGLAGQVGAFPHPVLSKSQGTLQILSLHHLPRHRQPGFDQNSPKPRLHNPRPQIDPRHDPRLDASADAPGSLASTRCLALPTKSPGTTRVCNPQDPHHAAAQRQKGKHEASRLAQKRTEPQHPQPTSPSTPFGATCTLEMLRLYPSDLWVAAAYRMLHPQCMPDVGPESACWQPYRREPAHGNQKGHFLRSLCTPTPTNISPNWFSAPKEHLWATLAVQAGSEPGV